MLNQRQIKFCEQYSIHGNATKAAEEAGYSKKTAYSIGQRLLKNVEIKKYIRNLQQKTTEALNITREEVTREMYRLGFSNVQDFFDKDGNLKGLHELSPNAAASISSIEIEEVREISKGRKKITTQIKKIKLWDKRGALDGLAKMLGYNAPEKKEVKVDINQFNGFDAFMAECRKINLDEDESSSG